MRKILTALLVTLFFMAAVAAADAIPDRLSQAKAGEWVLMTDTSDASSGEKVKFTAVEVRPGDPGVLVLKREHFTADGTVDESREIEVPFDRQAKRMADLKEKAKQISTERLWVKDKEFTVTAVSWDDDKGEGGEPREFKMWLSEELPLGGVAKFWS